MRLCLVGADFEENLGVGMIAASAEQAGHQVSFVPFNTVADTKTVARRVVQDGPDVVGLSIQFQHRVYEFLALARCLRAAGFRGHITCGGQFPSLAWKQTLEQRHGVDSVTLHEGERTIVDLLDAIGAGRRLHDIPGLALRSDDGVPMRTGSRSLVHDLDQLPMSRRYRPHTRHMGIPFIPVMASRGCWEACSYCSITAFYKDAKAYGGGKLIRHRSPKNVAEELAVLWHRAGGTGIFCFHDDNFLLPNPKTSLKRVREIREELDKLGVTVVGLVGKSRPDCIDAELAKELRRIGVIRLYIGVENASELGACHLSRGTPAERADQALTACRQAGIFVCYNLLIFEPDAKVEHIGENLNFIRRHAHYPVNFCRAEPYFGTPLHKELDARDAVGGSYLGFDYRITDDRAELLFRICSAAFRQRNFAPDGVANRYMGLGYAAKLVEQFYSDPHGKIGYVLERADNLTRGISRDTADYLEEAAELALGPLDHEVITRKTALLGLRIAEADARWHAELDVVYNEMASFGEPPAKKAVKIPGKLMRLAQSMVLGASLALGTALASGGCNDRMVVDPVPSDMGLTDAGDGGTDMSADRMVVDPAPPDLGMDMAQDMSQDAMVVDPPPPDMAFDMAQDNMVVDPVPPDMPMDMTPSGSVGPHHGQGRGTDGQPVDDFGQPLEQDAAGPSELAAADVAGPGDLNDLFHWTDSSPRRATRSTDLPLFAPPSARLQAVKDGEKVVVSLKVNEPVTTRWEATGEVTGVGQELARTEVTWTPSSPTDLLRVAVRTRGGVAVLELRARDVERPTSGHLLV
jgi:radical SAM superfamily enzyme YgiQ (UPF0313 family)